MNVFDDIEFFDLHEFDSPDELGSGSKMQRSTLLKLDKARELADIPFFITSGYRTKRHNQKVGGVNGSSHTKGHAIDISATSSTQRFKIFNALLQAGFERVGISKNFIHADDDPLKSKQVLWLY